MAAGGIYEFKNLPENPSKPDREVPDTFHLMAEYSAGHSLVLTSSMANSQHIPGLIRGHEGTIIMVEHGRFEGFAPHITLKPEVSRSRDGAANPVGGSKYKFGVEETKIPVKEVDTMVTHVTNFLDCMISREKPTLDVETAARAQVLITMAVLSYRQGKVLYFDEQKFRIVDKAPTRA
jgi:predicted dehydrogenase